MSIEYHLAINNKNRTLTCEPGVGTLMALGLGMGWCHLTIFWSSSPFDILRCKMQLKMDETLTHICWVGPLMIRLGMCHLLTCHLLACHLLACHLLALRDGACIDKQRIKWDQWLIVGTYLSFPVRNGQMHCPEYVSGVLYGPRVVHCQAYGYSVQYHLDSLGSLLTH